MLCRLYTILILLLFIATGGDAYGNTLSPTCRDGVDSLSDGSSKVALVLGGGGAKGAAHVGVLKVIEEAGIHPDIIVGTSIGGIVGGLYSIGYKAAELDSLFHSQQWLQLFTNEAIRGNAIKTMLDSLVNRQLSITAGQLKFQSHFSCVAADLRLLTEVVLSDDSLARNMRASMAIPALFKPVRYDDYVLYDGGMINNLPVDVARQMGADIVIAVDLTVNHHEEKDGDFASDLDNILGDIVDIKSMKGILGWLLNRPDFKKYRKNCKDADVYINPVLDGYSATSFTYKDIHRMMTLGESAAREQFAALSEVSKK